MTIGQRIKFLRKKRAMTQEELSLKAKLGHNAVSRYESDSVEISPKAIIAISEALGVEPIDLTTDPSTCYFASIDPLAFIPRRAHESDAGYDLFSPKYDIVPAHGTTVIDTGVHIAIPEGVAGLLVSKSGLNTKYSVLSTGLIDSGYTGSIKVKLYNHSNRSYEIRPKDKISQIVFIPIIQPTIIKIDRLEDTERGDNGFGSTGR